MLVNKKSFCSILMMILLGFLINQCSLFDGASGNNGQGKKTSNTSSLYSLLLLSNASSSSSSSASCTSIAKSCIYKQSSSYSASTLTCMDSGYLAYGSLCTWCDIYKSLNYYLAYNNFNCKDLGFTDGMNSSSYDYQCSYNANSSNMSSSTQPCNSTIINNYFGIDKTSPEVSSCSPVDKTTSVSTSTSIIIYFSEELDVKTVTTANVILTKGGTTVSSYTVNYDYSGKSIQIPSYNSSYSSILTSASNYTVTVNTNIKDIAGNPLKSSYTFSFTTK